jgi:hypothetical protein
MRGRNATLQTQTYNPRGLFTFNPGPTALNGNSNSGSANAFAAFLLDQPTQLGRDLDVQWPTRISSWYFLYANDQWQVSRKLTVNLGTRWEIWPATSSPHPGQFVNYDPATNSLLVGGYGSIPANLGVHGNSKAFAPRVGVAYRLNERTVLRTGFGMSYAALSTGTSNYPATQAPVYNGVNSYSAAGSMQTGFPAPNVTPIPSNGIITNAPLNLTYSVATLNPKQRYVESWNVAIQRQLPGDFSLDVAYVGNHGVNDPISLDINRGQIPGGGASGQPLYVAFGRTASVSAVNTYVTTNYHALQLKLEHRFGHGLLATTSFTHSKSLDYYSDTNVGLGTETIIAYGNFRQNRAPSDFDRTNTLIQNFVYELPFGRQHRWVKSGIAAALFGNWQINGVATAMSGLPFNITIANTSLNMPDVNNRPSINGPITVLGGIGPGSLYFNTSAFYAPAAGTFGNLGRNVGRGPGLVGLDASLFRKIRATERMVLDIRFETFNTTNTAHFNNPGTGVNPTQTTFGTSTFGLVTTTLNDSRGVQLGAKLSF